MSDTDSARDEVRDMITEALVWSEAEITREQAVNAAPTVCEWLREYFDIRLRPTAPDDPARVVIERDDLDLIVDAAEEYLDEQTARVPNMILDVDRNSTAYYITNVRGALDRVHAAAERSASGGA